MRSWHCQRQGFTLVEIMIVVAIIGLLAAIAIPSFVKARKRAQATTFISDLRVACDAFELYTMEKGTYPPDKTPGVIPPGMADYLAKTHWTEKTPIGGQWDWDNGQFGSKAGVSVYEPDRTVLEMQEIDKMIDDGNLGTGIFRQRAQGYIMIIEP
jgi:type IV pilus assembly protein PilA